jgi:hypothetical protein
MMKRAMELARAGQSYVVTSANLSCKLQLPAQLGSAERTVRHLSIYNGRDCTMPKRSAPPKYARHSSGQARVRIKGRVIYLGEYGSPESRE